MNNIRLREFDFSKLSFKEIFALAREYDSAGLPEEFDPDHLAVQALPIDHAFFLEVLQAFLDYKGLGEEYRKFKEDQSLLAQHFSPKRMQKIYSHEVEYLIAVYEYLPIKLTQMRTFTAGDKVWYEADGDKYATTIQRGSYHDGVDCFCSIEYKGKLLENVNTKKLSVRYD